MPEDTSELLGKREMLLRIHLGVMMDQDQSLLQEVLILMELGEKRTATV